MIKSWVIVELRALIKEFYPDINARDIERWGELLEAIPQDEYRREDLLITLDQAYCENHDEERALNRKMFAS